MSLSTLTSSLGTLGISTNPLIEAAALGSGLVGTSLLALYGYLRATLPTTIATSIVVEASAEEAWKVLSDFDTLPSWSTFINSVKGTPKVGSQWTVKMGGKSSSDDKNAFTAKATCAEYDASKFTFAWYGVLGVEAIFHGTHKLKIVPISPTQCRLEHGEQFGGVLYTFVFGLGKYAAAEKAYHNFNKAFKKQVERKA
eukprot:TRINITY_DN11857_c0_g1_i1.p1 TRINITY_DN11857_c0_g1~~TRINITY_DN11857_c0_g1_i1.p1  ORF type:complete len:210 (-),score=60.82 TRINITY_DN11857_c0_g1_i1:91-684(-)